MDSATVKVANDIGTRFSFGKGAVGTYRPGEEGDHTAGLAVDFMTYADYALGDRVAAYIQQHAPALGVRYIIWKQKIWNIERADEGWRLMEDRGSPTQNHMDHVHVSVYPTSLAPGVPDCGDPGDPIDGAGGDCFPGGWGLFNPAEWVLKPIKCALSWAVNPTMVRAGIPWGGFFSSFFSDMGGSMQSTPMWSWVTMLDDFKNELSDLGDDQANCRGPSIDTRFFQDAGGRFETFTGFPPQWEPFSACTGTKAEVAAICNMILSAMIMWGTTWKIARIVGRIINYDVSFGPMNRGA